MGDNGDGGGVDVILRWDGSTLEDGQLMGFQSWHTALYCSVARRQQKSKPLKLTKATDIILRSDQTKRPTN